MASAELDLDYCNPRKIIENRRLSIWLDGGSRLLFFYITSRQLNLERLGRN